MSDEIFVKFRMRNEENNNTTHDNRVDHSIENATLWKLDYTKHVFALLLYLFSLGIVYLLTMIFPSWQILLTLKPATIDEAEYIVITDNNSEKHIQLITKEFYLSSNDPLDANDVKNSLYYSKRNYNCSKAEINFNESNESKSLKEQDSQPRSELLEMIVIYMLNKYRYDYRLESFVPIDMDLSTYPLNELHDMKNGIPSMAIFNYLKSYYPCNDISITDHGTFTMVCKTCFTFFNIYSLFCIGIWAWGGYWQYSIVILIFNIIIILVTICLWNSNLKSVMNFNSKTIITIKRGFDSSNNYCDCSSKSIVPGDIIVLNQRTSNSNEKKEIIVPCDGLLLEGYCTVDESDLTGENTLVLKKELLNNDEKFIYKKASHSFLYQGTRISSLFSRKMGSNSEYDQIYVLATNTGYNTYRGDMILNWQFQKPEQEKMNSDLKVFSILMFVIWIILIVPLTWLYKNESIETILFRLCDSLIVILPPSLPISISITTFYFNYILRRKDISCIIDKKMNAAGLIRRIVLDKTGTLTESQLDIYCFQTTCYNHKNELTLDLKEFSTSTLNKTYKLFWKKIYRNYKSIDTSYQENYMNNLVYFVECLASCHEVYKIRNETIGNSIDQKIFLQMNWEMVQEDIHDIKSQIRIEPHNAYKITENVDCEEFDVNHIQINKETPHMNNNKEIESNCNHNHNQFFPKPNFYLQYLKRYEFSSLSQSISVVVRNSIDNTIRLYMKGAPERIQMVCASDSIPIDLNEKLRNYTKDGYRVFACATRILSEWDKNNLVDHYQKDMTFLGLIIFDNPIKKDTKDYVQHILDSNCKISIATGDNVFTTISVAQQCNIIKKNANIFIIEIFEENHFRGITVASTVKLEKAKENEESSLDSIDNTIKDIDVGFDKIIQSINNDIDSIICSSGSALNHLIKNKDTNDTMKLLASLLKKKGIIFFRMIPADKSQLVSFFQEDKTNLVVMCGDGANDCKALMTADVGVAINQSYSKNLICHFSSRKDSIECLELILMNGRAFFENNIIIFKFILISAIIQETTVLLLNLSNRSLSNVQLIYFHFVCVLLPIILASQTQAASKLSSFPQQKLSTWSYVIGLFCQVVIQIAGQISYYFYIMAQDLNSTNDESIINSYLFMFSVFQIITCLFIFNFFSLQRKRFYTNKFYLIYFTVIVYLSICSLIMNNFVNIFGVISVYVCIFAII